MDNQSENLSAVEDFLKNEVFRRWVTERQPADRAYWQAWLAINPDKKAIYEQAIATFLVLEGTKIELTDQTAKQKAEQIVDQMVDFSAPIRPLLGWAKWMAAAAIVSVLVWWRMDTDRVESKAIATRTTERKETIWKQVKNTTGIPLVVLLPDSSSVLLSSGSQLRFNKQTNQRQREVYLEGEGFFEVTKNPDRPFIVYTPTLTTKVLGTSFQVRSFDNETSAYVRVKTGKVSVLSAVSPKKPILLRVNEQLRLDTKTDKMLKQNRSVVDEQSSSIISEQFVFNYTPIPVIFDQLEDSYHMPIVYDQLSLKKCTFTGQLNDVPFLEKIRLICLAIDSTFEVVDNQLIIHSHGCS